MAELELRVTPEVLESKADDFSDLVRDIQTHFDQIEAIASKSTVYWQGEAGDRDRQGYAAYKDDIAALIARLDHHSTELLAMAGIYREAEQDVAAQNAQLKTDQIV
jgi:WXG100 family type VII secretion target